MLHRIIGVFLMCLAISISSASAATVVYDESVLADYGVYSATEILGLSVGETTYNVEFVYSTYNSLWGTGFDVPDQATAWSVRNAINTALNNSGLNTEYVGGPWPLYKWYLIPYATHTDGRIIFAEGWEPFTTDEILWVHYSDQYFDPDTINLMGARLSTVPIPGAALLFGSSILGIVSIRRKLKK